MSANSDNLEGAASAAPSIIVPQDPEAAEQMLARLTVADHVRQLMEVSDKREQGWRRVRLLAERRYGQLIGPAEHGGARSSVSETLANPEKQARKQARKVAAVPEPEFNDYINSEPEPTRAGLFRKTTPPAPPRERKRAKTVTPPEAAERLQKRLKQVRSLDARVRPRWTLEDVDDVELVLKHPPKRRAKYAGKRLRELSKTRHEYELSMVRYRMVQLIGILETLDVTSYDLSDPDAAGDFYDDLVRLQTWMETAITLAGRRLDDVAFGTKIRQLRNTNGRTEPEAATALRLADKLERKRRDQHLATST